MVIIRRLSLVAAVAVPCKAILQPRQVLMPTSSTLKIWGEPKVLVTRPLSQDDISISCLDNTQQGPSSTTNKGKEKKKPSESVLRETQAHLCDFTTNFFIVTLDQERFHPNITLDNRISGNTVQGFKYYNAYLGFVKLYGLCRFVTVSSRVCQTYINEEEQSITIHFRFFGLGFIETALKFFPKQLYKRENVIKEQRIWLEAVSTYYLDSDGQIIRHVVDDKDIDHDRVVKNPFERLKERLAKHIKTPAPAAI